MSFQSYRSLKDSGFAWLGIIPSHWEVVQSRRFFAERKERARPGDEQLTASQKHGILTQKEFAYREGQKVMQVITGLDILKHVEPDDFVISMRSFQGGLEHSSVKGCISSAYVIIIPRLDCLTSFYRHLFKSSSYILALQATSNLVRDGQALRYENFTQVSLPLPPEIEQKAIAAFLDRETAKIDALVEEQRRLIALLKEKRQAVISHAVTRGLEPDAPMKDSGIELLGEVPLHWEVGPLKRYVKNLDGRRVPLSSEERSHRPGTFPYYGASGIIDYIDGYIFDEDLILVSEDGANLINRSSPISFVARGQYWVNNHAHILRPNDGQNNYWAERIEAIDLAPFVTGAAQPKLTADALANLKVAVPPSVVERQQIERAIDLCRSASDPLLAEAHRAIALLMERRSALIALAVTGKIDVRSSANVLPVPIDRVRTRGLVAAEIIERSARQANFGRVKLQKIAYLAETHVGVSELEGSYLREAAGPLDRETVRDMEREAGRLAGIRADQPEGAGTAVSYQLGDLRGAHRAELTTFLGADRSAKLDKLIDDIATIDTKGAEAVATLYAVWNDALIEGDTPTDSENVLAVLTEWHPEKKEKFRMDELHTWLGWMRRHDLVPHGTGPKTSTGRLFA